MRTAPAVPRARETLLDNSVHATPRPCCIHVCPPAHVVARILRAELRRLTAGHAGSLVHVPCHERTLTPNRSLARGGCLAAECRGYVAEKSQSLGGLVLLPIAVSCLNGIAPA